jgi:hypothetical protein
VSGEPPLGPERPRGHTGPQSRRVNKPSYSKTAVFSEEVLPLVFSPDSAN